MKTNIFVATLVLISVAVWAFDEMGGTEEESNAGFPQMEFKQPIMPQDYVAQNTVSQNSMPQEQVMQNVVAEPTMPTSYDEQQSTPENNTSNQTNISEKCIKSMSHLYRFYFHEIYPNPKNEACKKLSETMSPKEAAEMQVVINELKNNCPAPFVKQIHASFTELKKERDA
ncbi:MAG: hypothetical protein AB7I18_07680 [Candidatus Berkiella sp.]